jgi:hypothetical protein
VVALQEQAAIISANIEMLFRCPFGRPPQPWDDDSGGSVFTGAAGVSTYLFLWRQIRRPRDRNSVRSSLFCYIVTERDGLAEFVVIQELLLTTFDGSLAN